MWWQDCNL